MTELNYEFVELTGAGAQTLKQHFNAVADLSINLLTNNIVVDDVPIALKHKETKFARTTHGLHGDAQVNKQTGEVVFVVSARFLLPFCDKTWKTTLMYQENGALALNVVRDNSNTRSKTTELKLMLMAIAPMFQQLVLFNVTKSKEEGLKILAKYDANDARAYCVAIPECENLEITLQVVIQVDADFLLSNKPIAPSSVTNNQEKQTLIDANTLPKSGFTTPVKVSTVRRAASVQPPKKQRDNDDDEDDKPIAAKKAKVNVGTTASTPSNKDADMMKNFEIHQAVAQQNEKMVRDFFLKYGGSGAYDIHQNNNELIKKAKTDSMKQVLASYCKCCAKTQMPKNVEQIQE